MRKNEKIKSKKKDKKREKKKEGKKEKRAPRGVYLTFFFVDFRRKMCVFVSRPMKIVTFLRKNGESPKRVVDFPRERDTFRNKIMEIVKDFDEKSYNNNGKPWKS